MPDALLQKAEKAVGKSKRGAAESKGKAEMYRKGTDRQTAVARLANLIKGNNNEPIVIKSRDGEEARLSKNSIGKLVSKEAADKSISNGFTREQHFAAAADIDNLFRNSVKVLTHKDRMDDPNIVAIHRFAAPLYGDNAAYITVKEATEHGKRIYSVELIEMGKLEGKWNESRLESSSRPTSSSPDNNIQKNPAAGTENVRFSLSNLSKKNQETAKKTPQYRIYRMVLGFFKNDLNLWGGNIDNLYAKANAKWHKQKKQGKAGMDAKHNPELDKLAERIAEDPELAALIGWHTDEAGAGERAVEIASRFQSIEDKDIAMGGLGEGGANRL